MEVKWILKPLKSCFCLVVEGNPRVWHTLLGACVTTKEKTWGLRPLGVSGVAEKKAWGLKTSNACVATKKKHWSFFITSKPFYFPILTFLLGFNKNILMKKHTQTKTKNKKNWTKNEKAQIYDKLTSSLVCTFFWEAASFKMHNNNIYTSHNPKMNSFWENLTQNLKNNFRPTRVCYTTSLKDIKN